MRFVWFLSSFVSRLLSLDKTPKNRYKSIHSSTKSPAMRVETPQKTRITIMFVVSQRLGVAGNAPTTLIIIDFWSANDPRCGRNLPKDTHCDHVRCFSTTGRRLAYSEK